LFYSNFFRAVFYRGVKGENLFHYIKKGSPEETEKVTEKAAAWLAKLHKLPTRDAINFNKQNSRIDTAIPGRRHILDIIGYFYPEFQDFYQHAYEYMARQERSYLRSTDKRWVIHGDAHPENVIKISKNKVAFIDFNDLCLGDLARDVGSFMQQLDYMAGIKANDKKAAQKLKDIFLASYLKHSKLKPDDSFDQRMELYYNWTALRTATYFLLRHNPSKEKAEPLIKGVEEYLESRRYS
jgi:Ser/Thr protein kinase RdoA (MazF antagonist)